MLYLSIVSINLLFLRTLSIDLSTRTFELCYTWVLFYFSRQMFTDLFKPLIAFRFTFVNKIVHFLHNVGEPWTISSCLIFVSGITLSFLGNFISVFGSSGSSYFPLARSDISYDWSALLSNFFIFFFSGDQPNIQFLTIPLLDQYLDWFLLLIKNWQIWSS